MAALPPPLESCRPVKKQWEEEEEMKKKKKSAAGERATAQQSCWQDRGKGRNGERERGGLH